MPQAFRCLIFRKHHHHSDRHHRHRHRLWIHVYLSYPQRGPESLLLPLRPIHQRTLHSNVGPATLAFCLLKGADSLLVIVSLSVLLGRFLTYASTLILDLLSFGPHSNRMQFLNQEGMAFVRTSDARARVSFYLLQYWPQQQGSFSWTFDCFPLRTTSQSSLWRLLSLMSKFWVLKLLLLH